ncbi:MAG: AhpC/TSA family protein [Muribaculaceae bacterium]|nr:AhpC/TSA family protein [Muribaculaceae bacterium]
MKKIISICSLSVFCAAMAFGTDYAVTVKTAPEYDNTKAYLVNYDTGDNIDSTMVTDNQAVFNGQVKEPLLTRLIINGNRIGQFILEDGDITIDLNTGDVVGGPLNAKKDKIEAQIAELSNRLQSAETDSLEEVIFNEYDALIDKSIQDNLDNPVGYMMFMNRAYDLLPEELEAFLAANPYFTQFERVRKLLESNRRKLATSEGAHFADFEIEYEGVKHKLSDVVGKGDYVLVDFWASWCGPCIRQTAVLKDIYAKYADKGLKILGVAVWDEPENTKKAIVQHELPWECWLNGQNVPTDIYGISGIPCIILFGPDGTILSRDKQSDELKAAVDNAMSAVN